MKPVAAGLYIHIPYCSAICPYCDFAVTTGSSQTRAAFLKGLEREVERWREFPCTFDTVYFGGGTPSILGADALESLLGVVKTSLQVTEDAWVFLEANPEDVDAAACEAWKRLGVRTLSLGIQSFDADELRFLGRRHSPREAREAVEAGLAAGFSTVSLDLIYGLPGQELELWKSNLEQAVALGPCHISAYQLTVSDGTPFAERRARGRLEELEESQQARYFGFTHEYLAAHGFPGYEVSNFARAPEYQSRHNRKYWHHVPYLGLGPSAHSFHGSRRWWNVREAPLYVAKLDAGEDPVAGSEELTSTQLALEAVMLRLRTTEGIDLSDFREQYGVDLAACNHDRIAELVERGWVVHRGRHLALTLAGLAVADGVAAEFALG